MIIKQIYSIQNNATRIMIHLQVLAVFITPVRDSEPHVPVDG